MKLWLIQMAEGPVVINPKGMVFDEEYLKKLKRYEFEIPDNTTDYMFMKWGMRLVYVIDGRIHVTILDFRKG